MAIFSTGRDPRLESLPASPAEEVVTGYQKEVLPQLAQALTPQVPTIGRSAAAGIAAQPQALQDLAASFFPTTQPTTPQAAVEAVLPGIAAPLERQFQEQSLPALQAAFQAMGAGRSGQGGAQAEQLYGRVVGDRLTEALAKTAVQQAQFNQEQELERRKAQVGLLAPQDQAVANLMGQTLGIRPPTQTVVPMPAEQPGIGTQLGTAAAISGIGSLFGLGGGGGGGGGAGGAAGPGALITRLGGGKPGDPGFGADASKYGVGGAAAIWLGKALGLVPQDSAVKTDSALGAGPLITQLGGGKPAVPINYDSTTVPANEEWRGELPALQVAAQHVDPIQSLGPDAASAATMLADPQYHTPQSLYGARTPMDFYDYEYEEDPFASVDSSGWEDTNATGFWE